MTPFSLHLFATTPFPHRRINAPSLLLAFAHIHGASISVFVNDILIACANNTILCQIKQENQSDEMPELDLLKRYSIFDHAGISLNKSNYTDQLFDKYFSCLLPRRNYSDLPMKRGHIHREEPLATERQKAIVNAFPYSEITDAVLYLSVDWIFLLL
jgi:hypothetical protein